MRVLVAGATGYVGGRLVPRLLDAGHQVRVFVRDPSRIRGRTWADRVEVVQGDLLQPDTLPAALEGQEAAYFLVHSMGAGRGFEEKDRQTASNFAQAASDSGLGHLVYLGGLQPQGPASAHLRSRAAVGEILRAALPTTEFRAGPIVGSGSASFEMVRYLTERLPVMLTPRWVSNEVQPIGIRDVLAYLLAALEKGPSGIVEIGCSERLSFGEMMLAYAEVRGLHRRIVPLPFLAPRLAARWVEFVTPIPNSLAIPLIEGVIRPVVADTHKAEAIFPEIHPSSYRAAVEGALRLTWGRAVETRWSGALGGGAAFRLTDREGMIREVRSRHVLASPLTTFEALSSIGGEKGWLVWEWAWGLRGLLDRLVGGPGLRRGRRDPLEVLPGEAVDFWRVEEVVRPELLRLRAEMKVPGRAWLQWEVSPEGDGSRLVQTAIFEPKGLAGTLYWYVLYPLHALIFSDLARAVARDAERGAVDVERVPSVSP